MGLTVHFTALSLFNSVAAIDLFHFYEQDIFVMTDEEKNVGTEHWPSKENIVGSSRGVLAVVYPLTPAKLTNAVAGHGQSR